MCSTLGSSKLWECTKSPLYFLKYRMELWEKNPTLYLNHPKGAAPGSCLNISRGIFRGDSLSPFLLFLSLIHFSNALNTNNYGYKAKKKVSNHLFYMDDLKIFAKNDNDFKGIIKALKCFSDDIGYRFRIR